MRSEPQGTSREPLTIDLAGMNDGEEELPNGQWSVQRLRSHVVRPRTHFSDEPHRTRMMAPSAKQLVHAGLTAFPPLPSRRWQRG